MMFRRASQLSLFQPTLPVRGATLNVTAESLTPNYFNPRSPCGERQGGCGLSGPLQQISTHAPRAGSDVCVIDGTLYDT